MTTWDPKQLDALAREAERWVGTPFVPNAATLGRGICCHRLVAEVYFGAGWLPRVEIPGGSVGWARGSDRSLMEAWLDGDGGVALFAPAGTSAGTMEPGDLLGFRIGHCVHHLAIRLTDDRIAHAVHGHGAAIVHGLPHTWASRLARVWRPRRHP